MLKYKETNKVIQKIEIFFSILLFVGSSFLFVSSFLKMHEKITKIEYLRKEILERDFDVEDYSEDNTICEIAYVKDDLYWTTSISYEEYLLLEDKQQELLLYQVNDDVLCFKEEPSQVELEKGYKEYQINKSKVLLNIGCALLILNISVLLMYSYAKVFTNYEKCWFLLIMVLATIFAILFPEESANGISGILIMLFYLLDTFLNILCELLISKQSRYNFLVSVLVEIVEIVICFVLKYRFATMVVTLLFWLPIDIVSYFNWSRHKDEKEEELTIVRRLKGYQEVLVIMGILVWTVVVGYFISGLHIQSDFIQNKTLETFIVYIDACASAVGIANGLFILFRLREQWIAWYICAILEGIINILSGQYVLLILKLGYITNTTYGYIKWSKYITSKEKSN